MIEPIGVFHSSALHPYEARRQGSLIQSQELGVVELKKGQGFEQALEDLDGFERIWLLYVFHQNSNWAPKVQPPRGELFKRGVFATRSPHRPNPIGLSCVELVKVEGLKVFVRGFDLLDQTPILDIKPYIPYADSFPDSRVGWLEGLDEKRVAVSFSPQAEAELKWLERNGIQQFRGFLASQLEFNPTDHKRKRVMAIDETSGQYRIAYRTWRADFHLRENLVVIEKIRSGYSLTDLENPADRYQDKPLHREFVSRFQKMES